MTPTERKSQALESIRAIKQWGVHTISKRSRSLHMVVPLSLRCFVHEPTIIDLPFEPRSLESQSWCAYT